MTMRELRVLANRLVAAEKRAHVSSYCRTCGAANTMNVEDAKEKIVRAVRELATK